MLIDARLHEPGPHLAWPADDLEARYRALTEITLAWMQTLSVDRALINPRDPAWADYAVRQAPDRFAAVQMVPSLDDADESAVDLLERYLASNDNLKAIRMGIGHPPTGETARAIADGEYDEVLERCEEKAIPVFLFATHFIGCVAPLVERFPGVTFILDHLGLPQPPIERAESPLWRSLPSVLELARYPNLALKLCGAPALSEAGHPFDDVWPHLHRILEAFGKDRLMWASDQSRFYGRVGFDMSIDGALGGYRGKHDYGQSLGLFRDTTELSAAEKEAILGGTVQRLLRWP